MDDRLRELQRITLEDPGDLAAAQRFRRECERGGAPIRRIVLPVPFPHQREILNDPHRFKVVNGGRQMGKTTLGLIAATDGHGPRDVLGVPTLKGALHGKKIWWVTRDYPTATKIWRDLKGALARWGGELEKSEVERRIDFPGGGSLAVKSAHDPDSLRGETLDGVVGDETAFWNEDALYLSLRPAIAVKNGWMLLISTPNQLNFFREEWEKGTDGFPKRDPLYKSWHIPTSVNPAISKAELEQMRRTLGAYGFRRECLAEFEVREGGMFKADWFRSYRAEADRFVPLDGTEPVTRRELQNFVSADLAWSTRTYADFTVVMAWARSQDGRLWALAHTRGQLDARDVGKVVAGTMEKWGSRALLIESSGPLVKVNAELKARFPGRVREYAVHAGPRGGNDKVSRAQPAAAAVESGRVLLPEGAPWVREFVSECCAFPDGDAHDDQVDALALAVLATTPARSEGPEERRERFAEGGSWRRELDDRPDWYPGYEGDWEVT